MEEARRGRARLAVRRAAVFSWAEAGCGLAAWGVRAAREESSRGSMAKPSEERTSSETAGNRRRKRALKPQKTVEGNEQ